jgi:hypothetical protein
MEIQDFKIEWPAASQPVVGPIRYAYHFKDPFEGVRTAPSATANLVFGDTVLTVRRIQEGEWVVRSLVIDDLDLELLPVQGSTLPRKIRKALNEAYEQAKKDQSPEGVKDRITDLEKRLSKAETELKTLKGE